MKEILHWTQRFFAVGIAIIPLFHRSKLPAVGSWERFKTQLPSHTEYQTFFASGWNNYGVVAGWKDLAFLDFDERIAFELWLDWYSGTRMPLPFIVRSARGAHVYFSVAERRTNERRLGCDVKFHGYVVGPGSTHPSGTQYVAMSDWHLLQVGCLDEIMPDALFPVVAGGSGSYSNAPVEFTPTDTEYDVFQAAADNKDLVSKIKSRVRIETLFTDTRRTSADGRWLAAKCLFHDDSNPSAWIDTWEQWYGCQVCGFKRMDVINVYSRVHNLNNNDAIIALAREIGVWK